MTEKPDETITASMSEAEAIAYLVEQAQELSELALKSGKPEASALFTLAASDLRQKTG